MCAAGLMASPYANDGSIHPAHDADNGPFGNNSLLKLIGLAWQGIVASFVAVRWKEGEWGRRWLSRVMESGCGEG